MFTVARQLDTRPAAWASVPSVGTSARLARTGTTLVLLAVAYAAMSQGAFYPGQLRFTTLLVLAGLAVTLAATGLSRRDLGAPSVAAAALASWYLLAGALADDVSGAIPAVELLAALAAIVLIVRRADETERRGMLAGLIVVGSLLALVGWEGVAWRQVPRALEDGGLWRAASTITYANANGRPARGARGARGGMDRREPPGTTAAVGRCVHLARRALRYRVPPGSWRSRSVSGG